MTTRRQHIEVNQLPIEIFRKDIKNVYLCVYPPDGRVRVFVLRPLSDEAVRAVGLKRMAWIHQKWRVVAQHAPPPQFRMVTGETLDYLGRGYRL